MTKNLTINDIRKVLKEELKPIQHAIEFLRADSTDLEEHLNKKINGTEQKLSQKIAEEGSRLENKLGEKIDKIGERVENIERIHPGNKHVFPSTASC